METGSKKMLWAGRVMSALPILFLLADAMGFDTDRQAFDLLNPIL